MARPKHASLPPDNSSKAESHSSKRIKLKTDHFIKISQVEQPQDTLTPKPEPGQTEQDMVENNSSSGTDSSQSGWQTVRHQKRTLEHSTLNDVSSKSKLKKQEKLSAKKNLLQFPPEFHFNTRGFRHGKMIQLKDVRDLVLSIMADERNQEWMLVKNKSNIQKTVVLMIPGLTTESLGITKPDNSSIMPFALSSQDSKLPIFQSLFSHACPTKAAGDRLRMFSCLNVFLTCQLSAMAKIKRDEERKKNSQNASSIDPTNYLMPTEQMAEYDFPTLHYPTPISVVSQQQASEQVESLPPPPTFEAWLTHPQEGYIQTPMYPDGTLGKRPIKILGIDCEMCTTATGSELTRCTIVDWEEKLVYDELVLPDLPITDYLTRYSGITEERLKGIKTRLIDVQKKLSSIIDFDTILVGHSIDCDLRALKLSHPWVIDTSMIYQHPRGLPMKPSLKWLATKWLNKQIQNISTNIHGGHDSEEDARTAIQLFKKKLEKGFTFGEFSSDTESIFERISRVNPSKRSALVDFGSPSTSSASTSNPDLLPAPAPVPNKNNNWKHADCFSFGSDTQVAQGIVSALDDHDFVFARFMELSHALGWSQPYGSRKDNTEEKEKQVTDSKKDDNPSNSSSNEEEEEEGRRKKVEKVYENLNETLKKLSEQLPIGTSFIIFNGHSDPRPMAALNAKKNHFEKSMMMQNRHQQNTRSLTFIPNPLPKPTSSVSCTIPNQPEQEQEPKLENSETTKVMDQHTNPQPVLSWSNQDDRDLADAVEKCKIGMSFYRIQ